MSSVDLALRYIIIAVAWHLACAWLQTFQSPYPIVDAFELAGTAEEQLFKSLGISWRSLCATISMLLLISFLQDRPCSSPKYPNFRSCRLPHVAMPRVPLVKLSASPLS